MNLIGRFFLVDSTEHLEVFPWSHLRKEVSFPRTVKWFSRPVFKFCSQCACTCDQNNVLTDNRVKEDGGRSRCCREKVLYCLHW